MLETSFGCGILDVYGHFMDVACPVSKMYCV
jgi:hypothetical protein